MAEALVDIHREIVDACRRGDNSAYYQLYKLYSRAMFNAAFRIVKNEDEAEDILQESFLNAFRNIAAFKGDSTFGAWLKRIVVNKSISVLRKKHLEFLSMNDSHDEIADDNLPVDDVQFDLNLIKQSIEELPEGYRVVLSLYLLEGYDHQEISEILNISVSTSKSQYNRAKNKLRSFLNQKEMYYG